MRHTGYYSLFIYIAALLATSCADEVGLGSDWSPSLSPRQLSLSSYSAQMPVEGGSQTVQVTAQNVGWRFDGTDAAWLTLSPKSGESNATVTLTPEANTNPTTGRSVAYNFACTNTDWSLQRQFTVTQDAPGYYIRSTSTTITKGAAAQQFDEGVAANAEWTAQSDQEWLTLDKPNSTTLIIHLSDNTTSLSADRIAHITLSCGNATRVITVNQQPPNITVATDELVYENEGGDKRVEIKSDVPWTATCSQPWMTLSPAEGKAGTTSLLLRATKSESANERTANVYINIGGTKKKSIPIRQSGAYIDASVTSLQTFTYKGGSQVLSITANIDWTIIDKPEFVTTSREDGSKGYETVIVTVPVNNTNTSRSGDITFGNASITGLRTKVHVEQECANIGLSEQTITVPSTASTHQLTLTANQGWTAAFQTGTWAHVTPKSGNGDATLTLTADDNPSVNQREDVLTITPAVTNMPQTFRFIQKGKTLTVNTSEVAIHPKGGTSDPLIITTDGTYTVTKSGNWFTIAQSGNTVTATASANSTKNVRTGTITISLTDLPSGESLVRTVTVRQYPPDNIDGGGFTDDKNWDFDAGTSDATITVDGFTDDKNWDF